MNFAQAMYREGTHKLTENGAFAYDSTAQGALLDLFSQVGALRPRTETEIASKFAAARELGINSGTPINRCARGERKTAYGFKWKYAGEV